MPEIVIDWHIARVLLINFVFRVVIFFGVSTLLFSLLRRFAKNNKILPGTFDSRKIRSDLVWSLVSLMLLSSIEFGGLILGSGNLELGYYFILLFGFATFLFSFYRKFKFKILQPVMDWLNRGFWDFLFPVGVILALVYFAYVSFEQFDLSYGYIIYYDIWEYGIGYFVFSLIFVFAFHDFYFYWMHRLLHTKFLMKHVHRPHHNSTDPNVYTSYAFHPWEAILEFGIIPLLAFFVPINVWVFMIWQVIIIGFNVYSHMGYEFLPAKFRGGFFNQISQYCYASHGTSF
jgi:sterol desaturase/sphingolipid hydroxylase (fatty acid hydroxylase superfamily)